ncbi:hypothetical protein Pfo_005314, partial [Paulownia fortunei]
EDLKDPKKLYEMTILLNAQREIADKILDAQWETKWREEKLNEMLKEKVKPYLQNIDNSVLPQPIIVSNSHINLDKFFILVSPTKEGLMAQINGYQLMMIAPLICHLILQT